MLKEITSNLKQILEAAQAPASLDEHPWTKSLWVQQFAAQQPEINAHDAGYQLLSALSALFRETMPGTPPRRGKRIDTRWGQFGIIGALYFAPFDFGVARPSSLLDAWGRIDEVILSYAQPQPLELLSPEAIARYRLVGDEYQAGPVSTLSDWHLRGLERLAEFLRDRERLLSAQYACDSIVLNPQAEHIEISIPKTEPAVTTRPGVSFYRRHARSIWLSLLLVLVVFFGWQGLRTYRLYRAFKSDVDQLQQFLEIEPSLERVGEVGDLLAQTRQDVLALQAQIKPYRWGGRLLGWLPVYGGDLSAAGDLVDLASALVIAGDEAYRASASLIESANGGEQRPSIPEILNLLTAAQPGFEIAQTSIENALAARAAINIEQLSPKTRPLLEKVDPYLPLLEEGLPALMALPRVLGADVAGPQTYLVLIQNEDEIRATGGFITAAANITIENGELIAFVVKDSYDVDDLSRFYAASPWQMDKFMGEDTLTFRNANWSPDFPTTAMWTEHLNAYTSAHSVDGVIALGQEALRLLLTALGPLEVDGVDEPVTAENIYTLTRVLKDQSRETGDRKAFIGPLAETLLEELLNSDDLTLWQGVVEVMLIALDEHHILVQVDDPAIGALLAARGWNGAMQPGEGDYLMVVDSNVGWNKANAVVYSEIIYQVNLSQPESPQSIVTTHYTNPTPGDDTCRHGYYYDPQDTYQDYIERCYWNYQRIYTLAESDLLDAQIHTTPPEWFYRAETIPASVDILDNAGIYDENPEGLQGYGNLLVVPLGEERQTSFTFLLPAERVIQTLGDGQRMYQLHIQKQPGTLATPVSIQVQLPAGAEFVSAQPEGQLSGNLWSVEVALRTDLDLTFIWRMP